mgnify:CR=1 FL=1
MLVKVLLSVLYTVLSVNFIAAPKAFAKHRKRYEAQAVDGVLETEGDVHHLIASRVHDFSHLANGMQTRSRDFC